MDYKPVTQFSSQQLVVVLPLALFIKLIGLTLTTSPFIQPLPELKQVRHILTYQAIWRVGISYSVSAAPLHKAPPPQLRLMEVPLHRVTAQRPVAYVVPSLKVLMLQQMLTRVRLHKVIKVLLRVLTVRSLKVEVQRQVVLLVHSLKGQA